MTQTFSVSKLREFLTCEKRYEYKYVDGLLPRTYQRALEFGSIGHKFLEEWYKSIGNDKSPSYLYEIKDIVELVKKERGVEDFDAFSLQQFETDLYTVSGMIQAYTKFYEKDITRWDVLLIEQMLTLDVPFNNWILRGMPDLILRDKITKEIWVVDHKFLAQITQGLIKKLPLDYQVHAYLKMTKEWMTKNSIEGTLKGVIYNIVRKPSKRQKQGQSLERFQDELFADYLERPDEFFYRENITVTEHHIRNFDKFLDIVTKDLTAKHLSNEFKQNVFACDNYGECAYIQLCLRGKNEASYLFKNWFREKD